MSQIHGSCVAIGGKGVVLRGPSGSGKSDLALRLIDGGAELVADDRIELSVHDGRLIAAPPPTIAGLMEARGLGILHVAWRSDVAVRLVVDLVPAQEIERMPNNAVTTLEGIALPLARLAAFEASTAAKVRLALRAATAEMEIHR